MIRSLIEMEPSIATVVLVGISASRAPELIRALLDQGIQASWQPDCKSDTLDADSQSVEPSLAQRVQRVLRIEGIDPVGSIVCAGESASEPTSQQLNFDQLKIDLSRREITVLGRLVMFPKGEFDLLALLASRPGHVFTRNEVVFGGSNVGYPMNDRSVDVQIAGVRRKLGPLSPYIETVRGVGYRFNVDARP